MVNTPTFSHLIQKPVHHFATSVDQAGPTAYPEMPPQKLVYCYHCRPNLTKIDSSGKPVPYWTDAQLPQAWKGTRSSV